MIHISKTEKGFQVTTVEGNNGKVINSTVGLSSKAACIKNIIASADEHNSLSVYFQDNTLKKPVVYYMYEHQVKNKWIKSVATDRKPVKPYIPNNKK